MKPPLTLEHLILAVQEFCQNTSVIPELFGVTDGKAVGTMIEHRFKQLLLAKFELTVGNSAQGIDLPGDTIETDANETGLTNTFRAA